MRLPTDHPLTNPGYLGLVEGLVSLLLLLVVAIPTLVLLWRGVLEGVPADEALE